MKLFYNYYEDSNITRKYEIDFCLRKNLENDIFNIVIIESQARLTYNDFFRRINKLIVDENDINIICNSDIFFDETIELANKIQHNQVFALSRWDWYEKHPPVFFDRPDSQDTWIIRGTIKNVNGNFPLGKKGCDNRIAYEFNKVGYNVINPGKTIKSYHFHNSNIRTNTYHSDVVPEPYMTCHPMHLP